MNLSRFFASLPFREPRPSCFLSFPLVRACRLLYGTQVQVMSDVKKS